MPSRDGTVIGVLDVESNPCAVPPTAKWLERPDDVELARRRQYWHRIRAARETSVHDANKQAVDLQLLLRSLPPEFRQRVMAVAATGSSVSDGQVRGEDSVWKRTRCCSAESRTRTA